MTGGGVRPGRAGALAACILAGALTEAAAGEAGRVRVWLGPSLGVSSMSTTWASRYVPPFTYVEHSGTAEQALPVEGGAGAGLTLGLAVEVAPHVALEVLASGWRSALGGDAGTYDVDLRYVSFPPPSYQRTENHIRRSEEGPAAGGRLETLALAANFSVSGRAASRVRLGASGGLAWLRTTGRLEGLTYSSYHMGGHSTVWPEDMELAAEVRPVSGLGIDLGGFLVVELGRRLELRADGRWFGVPEREAELRVGEVLDLDSVILQEDVATIEANLRPAPLALSASAFRATVGLALAF